jgi:hypothetical protein
VGTLGSGLSVVSVCSGVSRKYAYGRAKATECLGLKLKRGDVLGAILISS